MCLQCNDDVVLLAQLPGVISARQVDSALRSVHLQTNAVGTHGGKMCSACHQAHLGAGLGKLGA